jgi:hypothetical protein
MSHYWKKQKISCTSNGKKKHATNSLTIYTPPLWLHVTLIYQEDKINNFNRKIKNVVR